MCIRDRWKSMPRLGYSLESKHKFGLHALFLMLLSNAMLMSRLPKELVVANRQNPNRHAWYRRMSTGMRLRRRFPALLAKMQKLMPLRHTDTAPAEAEHSSPGSVLGGNAGVIVPLSLSRL